METNPKFQIRTYSVQELALCYFRNSMPNSATCQLKKWLVRNTQLMHDIELAGYVSGQKLLTPRQVGVIVYYLGEP